MKDRIDTLNDRIDDLRDHVDDLHRDFMKEIGQLRERVAKVEGLLESIRDTIAKPQVA
ncbi:MAG: hypothetical protein OXC80_13285 [Gammaproteobacteria bacterium]|nr:hypothetical protein [Gammaproteobacteria bacterium]